MSKGVGVITGFAKEYPNVTTALLGGVGALAALTVGGIGFRATPTMALRRRSTP